MMLDKWEMYCSADEPGSPNPLRHFGPLGFAQHDTTAKRVLQVLVEVVEDPQPQDYWAWWDIGTDMPCHIAATEEQMTRQFRIGQSDAPGPREEERGEQGRIVRLRITECFEVCLRSGRYNWRITSAM